MKFKYISYTSSIWWLSVWFSPIIWGLAIFLDQRTLGISDLFSDLPEVVGGYLLILLISTAVSLPAYGVFILLNELIFQNSDDIIVGKIIASFFGLSIVYLLFEVFLGGLVGSSVFDDETLYLIIAYSFTIFFGIWYYEPFPKT